MMACMIWFQGGAGPHDGDTSSFFIDSSPHKVGSTCQRGALCVDDGAAASSGGGAGRVHDGAGGVAQLAMTSSSSPPSGYPFKVLSFSARSGGSVRVTGFPCRRCC